MSHDCETVERQRFPVLRKRMDEVMGKFLRDGVEPAERMITSIIEMEVSCLDALMLIFLFDPSSFLLKLLGPQRLF